jgi:ubiquinone/menaquinone biosynthesis C-methylase UbiE
MAFTIGLDFDRAINWDARLKQELPFINSWLKSWSAVKVIDVACGGGKHTAALAKLGYKLHGTDYSAEMIYEARKNCESIDVEFTQCDMRIKPAGLQAQDALLCLGNSLCLLENQVMCQEALNSFSTMLKPGAGLILHLLNYTRFRNPEKAFFPVRTIWENGKAIAHYQKYIELHDNHAYVHLIKIFEDGKSKWNRSVKSDKLMILTPHDLLPQLRIAGFEHIQVYGKLTGDLYQAESHDLIITAVKNKS